MSQGFDSYDGKLPKGVQQEISQLHDELFLTLVRLAWAVIRDNELAHDAAQEAFTLLTQKLIDNSEEIPPANRPGWLVKTTQFAAQNLRRKNKQRASEKPSMPVESLVAPKEQDELLANERRQELSKGINSLPETQRRVIELRFVSGLSFQEIADQESIALGTALSRFRLVIDKLKQQLNNE